MNSVILLLVIVVVVVIVLAFLKAKAQGGAGDEAWSFYAKKPLSQPEQVLYFRLIQASPSARVKMQHVLIIHEVADYPAWKKVFDAAAGIRKEAGERSYQILKYETDANKIVHFSVWTSIADAKVFFGSPRGSEFGSDGPQSTGPAGIPRRRIAAVTRLTRSRGLKGLMM